MSDSAMVVFVNGPYGNPDTVEILVQSYDYKNVIHIFIKLVLNQH